ncbi:MAG: box helicase [Solimicrobium sp.]|jgi:DNA ligase-associated metallophosphoesterase|nr:box helicase [Solimicrobium sp.]
MENSAKNKADYVVIHGGERLHLLPERAIWWPAQQTLLVADMHIGKAATFRSLGQPVPQGTTSETLARLDTLLATWPVRQLICLGDFLHARAAHAPQTLAALQKWRTRHPKLVCLLVRGNHDAHAGEPPPDLEIKTVDEAHSIGGLLLCHIPLTAKNLIKNQYSLAGHVHPAHVLRGKGRRADKLRLPCFVFSEQQGILPAFGAFTGHHTVAAQGGEALYVCGGDQVWAVP